MIQGEKRSETTINLKMILQVHNTALVQETTGIT